MIITDANARIIDVNDAFCRITGYSREDAIGKNPRFLGAGTHAPAFYAAMWKSLNEIGYWSGEILNRHKNGDVLPELQNITVVKDSLGFVNYYVAVFYDIAAVRERFWEMDRLATSDDVTKALSREEVTAALRTSMRIARELGTTLAVVHIDLDGFKRANDLMGHFAGDALLDLVTASLRSVVRHSDLIARVGGDEFIVVLHELPPEDPGAVTSAIVVKMLAAIKRAAATLRLQGVVTGSAGVTYYPQQIEVSEDQLLRQADHAMYTAKQQGRDRHVEFDIQQDRHTRGLHETSTRISEGIQNEEFVLYYQPKVNLRTGSILGVEALMRWRHPDRGIVPPGEYLPQIENTPLGDELGNWVIMESVSHLSDWTRAGLALTVSINISAHHLQAPDFTSTLRRALRAHPDVDPACLELEILESSALDDVDAASNVLLECKQIGVKVALDDFGTGYSSLTYLRRLPISVIKIDQSFVRNMLSDPDDLAVLESVLTLADRLRMISIAEGVETIEHGEMLLRMGCVYGQGYGIARPMPMEQVAPWITTWRLPAAWSQVPSERAADAPMVYAPAMHKVWMTAVHRRINGESVTPELDYKKCLLGKWIATERECGGFNGPAALRVCAAHKAVHDLAGQLIAQSDAGARDAAVSQLPKLHQIQTELINALLTYGDGHAIHQNLACGCPSHADSRDYDEICAKLLAGT